jgi:predicted ArsR family transcriptional regulator
VENTPARFGISHEHLARINALIRYRGNNVLTSAELAEGMRISPRQARRLLNRLAETGGALAISAESDGSRGRPFVHYYMLLK